MKITRRQLRKIIKENGDTDPSDGWPSRAPEPENDDNPGMDALEKSRKERMEKPPDEIVTLHDFDWDRMKTEKPEMHDHFMLGVESTREFRLDRDLLPFAKDTAAKAKIKRIIAKEKAVETDLKKENAIKITRKQLRQKIEETVSLIKEEEYDCIKDYILMGYSRSEAARMCKGSYSSVQHPLDDDGDGNVDWDELSENKISLKQLKQIIKEAFTTVSDEDFDRITMPGYKGPQPGEYDYLDSIDSQKMADAKRAVGEDPAAQAGYLGIGVEDWHRIRQELDDHYEDRHMEDQMAFDDHGRHPLDDDGDGNVDWDELKEDTNVQEGTETSQMPASWQQILGTCLD